MCSIIFFSFPYIDVCITHLALSSCSFHSRSFVTIHSFCACVFPILLFYPSWLASLVGKLFAFICFNLDTCEFISVHNESLLVGEHLFPLNLGLLDLGCEGARLHAFGLSCLLVCLNPRSIEATHTLSRWDLPVVTAEIVVSARGDFVRVSPDYFLGDGPGSELVLMFAFVFLYAFSHSRVTVYLPAYVIRISGYVYALTLVAWLVYAS